MRVHIEKVIGNFRRDQLFAVAADIESYPEFLPLCIAARIVKRHGDRMQVDNVFGLGGVRAKFRSEAIFDEPEGIHICSVDGPFRRLEINWRFQAVDDQATRVAFSLEQAFRSGITGTVTGLFTQGIERQIIGSFENRVLAVCQPAA